MSREEVRKLLGGYATGTLTSAEQEALFEAALQDQELFDALAREQSLRDLLRDPAAKAHLLAALDERPSPWYRRLGWWRPAAAAVAMAGLAAVAILTTRHPRSPQMEIVAQVTPPAAENRPAPAAPQMLDQVAIAPPKQKAAAMNRRYAAPAPAQAAAPTPVLAEPEAKPAESVAIGSISSGLRDARPGGRGGGGGGAAGGVVGGVLGGIAGGTPGAVPPPPLPQFQATPPVPDARNTVMVQAAAPQIQAAQVADAKTLFFGVPPLVQSFAPRQTAQNQVIDGSPAAPAQQQGQQGAQQAGQTQLARSTLQSAAQSAAKTFQMQTPANPGVRYKIVPQLDANGQSAGTVRVEFTANDNGTLTVTSAGQTLLSRAVVRMAPYTTEPLTPRGQELTVVFSRQGPVSVTRAEFDTRKEALKKDAVPQRSDNPEGTYVVGDPASPQVTFAITLKP